MLYVPKRIFFTKGVGRHREKLPSFEMALRDAGIAQFNLVKVSSIYPSHCKTVSKTEGLSDTMAGQILPVVMSENATNEPNRLVAATVGVAIPRDRGEFGYLSEQPSCWVPIVRFGHRLGSTKLSRKVNEGSLQLEKLPAEAALHRLDMDDLGAIRARTRSIHRKNSTTWCVSCNDLEGHLESIP
jgi:pyruvoyl-dependent arginine decarboxylase